MSRTRETYSVSFEYKNSLKLRNFDLREKESFVPPSGDETKNPWFLSLSNITADRDKNQRFSFTSPDGGTKLFFLTIRIS